MPSIYLYSVIYEIVQSYYPMGLPILTANVRIVWLLMLQCNVTAIAGTVTIPVT